MISNTKKQLEPLIAIISLPFLSWNPSILTLLSLISSALFFFGIVIHIYWLSAISIFGFIFDATDGYVARKKDKVSKYGAFLDSSLDRVSDFFLISSFGFGHLVSWELVTLVLFTSFFISYIRAKGETIFKTDLAQGLMQRTERIILLLLGFFLFILFPTLQIIHFNIITIIFFIIFILNCLTIFQRFWIIKNMSKV